MKPKIHINRLSLLSLLIVGGVFLAWARWPGLSPQTVESSQDQAASKLEARPLPSELTYVGSAACGPCHPQAAAVWRGSHHDVAMQEVTEETVLGAFDGATFRHGQETNTFIRDADGFAVTTADDDGDSGSPQRRDVRYTLGIAPLQQYLLAGDKGRLQALTVLWDARSETEGGQRWYSLYDEPIAPTDELHWSGPAFDWNYQCAECHSTGLVRGYRANSDSYETTFAELDVGCEACHGRGSAHLEWAEKQTPYRNRGLSVSLSQPLPWQIDDASGSARPRARSETEIQTCAPCHSRRTPLGDGHEPGTPFLDDYLPELLREGQYFADGQILNEVYVWGSFIQSKMYHAGVKCSDCHDPHSLKLRAQGNALCTRCHDERRFDRPAHTHHAPQSEGAACVSCHMPSRVYMGVDARRDHSLRIPRPALSERIGGQNACNRCHDDRSATWAAETIAQWRGHKEPGGHYGEALHLGRTGAPGAEAALLDLSRNTKAPAIARATALDLLARYPSAQSLRAIGEAAQSDNPLLRMGAALAAAPYEPGLRLRLLSPLIHDPVRAVRFETARALAPVALESLPPAIAQAVAQLFTEARNVFAASSSQPGAVVEHGTFEALRGNWEAAEANYQRALTIAPQSVVARLNLADLQRQRGDHESAERSIRAALATDPDSAEAHHALGLFEFSRGHRIQGMYELHVAAQLAPDNGRFAYVYAVALASESDLPTAIEVLDSALERLPNDVDLLTLLASYQLQSGNQRGATQAAQRALRLRADHKPALEILRQLAAGAESR